MFGRHPDKDNRVCDKRIDIDLQTPAKKQLSVDVVERETEDGWQRGDHLLRIFEAPLRQSRDLLVVGFNRPQVTSENRAVSESVLTEDLNIEIMAGRPFCC